MAITVDLTLPDYAALVARAGIDPDTEAAPVAQARPADVAGLARSFAQAGRALDESWTLSLEAADTVGAAFQNDGAPVLDRATHVARLPADFRDSGAWLGSMSVRLAAVSDELTATMRDTSAAVATMHRELAATRQRWARRVSAASGPGGTIPAQQLTALQAERERVAADATELVRRVGKQVVRRIGAYELVINRALQLAADRGFVSVPDQESFPAPEPDGRGGAHIDADDRSAGRGREDPRGSPHLSNDWAGRAILERYLTGGGDWNIRDDPDWTAYMQANDLLRAYLIPRNDDVALLALGDFVRSGQRDGTHELRYQMIIENGEGIVGHQYLHGTDWDAGGFLQRGTTQVIPQEDGTYQVVVNNYLEWNDTIDSNPQYSTDNWKNLVAEAFTPADPYRISIGWGAETTVTFDAQGNVIDRSGYP